MRPYRPDQRIEGLVRANRVEVRVLFGASEIAREMDDEIRRIVEAALTTARRILTAQGESLDRLADILLERETIDRHELGSLLTGNTEGRAERVLA